MHNAFNSDCYEVNRVKRPEETKNPKVRAAKRMKSAKKPLARQP